MLCVAVVRLLPPVSVPRLRTACFLEILCGSRASVIRLAAAFEDAMNAVFVVDSGSSNSVSPAMICLAAPAMLVTTIVSLPLDWMLISSTAPWFVLDLSLVFAAPMSSRPPARIGLYVGAVDGLRSGSSWDAAFIVAAGSALKRLRWCGYPLGLSRGAIMLFGKQRA